MKISWHLSLLVGLAALPLTGAWAQADWHAINCIPADLAPEEMFEVATPVDDFEEATPKWTAAQGDQQAKATVSRDPSEHHAGSASLRVDYNFEGTKKLEYIQLSGAAEFAQAGQAFGFWLKHDGTAFPVRLRILDKSGECHQFEMFSSATPGWQFVACSLDGASAAWGGDGNKRKDYPCKLEGICIDRPRAGYVGKGTLWIDDVAVLRPAKPPTQTLKVETQNARFGNVFAVGESIALRASGEGERVRWSVTDFSGREIKRGEGAAASTEIQFRADEPGWFACKLELLTGRRVLSTQRFAYAALAGGTEPARSDFVGVCSHFQGAYPLEAMELLQHYGVDQFRDEISWGSYEREKGHLAMPTSGAAFLKRATELKMRPLIIFDYANRLYDDGGYPHSPEAIEAFGRYAVDLTRQTRGMVNMFEVWNEWVGGCGMDKRPGAHDGEAYGRLLQPTYTAVKQAFPEVTVVGIGGEYGDRCAENILGSIRTAGTNAMDAWSIHPYRYPHTPEQSDLVGEVNRIQSKVAGVGEAKKAWVTEIGYPTHRGDTGSEEAAQARYVVRTLALLQSTRAVEKVFWYDYKDDGLTRDYNEDNFGLIHHQHFNCAPKPGMVAVGAFVRMTGGAEFRDLARPDGLYAAKYQRKDGSEVVLLWSTDGKRAVTVAGKLSAAYGLMGNAIPAMAIAATDSPIYLTGKNLEVTPKR